MGTTKYYKLSCVTENCASVDSRFLPLHALRRQGAFDDARKRTLKASSASLPSVASNLFREQS